MGDKRPLVAALVLVVIGVAAAVLFRKPNEPGGADGATRGESVLRRHEPVGLAAGARPVAVIEPDAGSSSAVGLVGRIMPVGNGAAVGGDLTGDSRLVTAVPPHDVDDVQRLPDVTAPPPSFLSDSSTLSRRYPSTSVDGQRSADAVRATRPPATPETDANWAISAANDRGAKAEDETTEVPHIRLHTIRDGDSLGSLAKRFLGDSGRFLEIYEANRDVLRSPEQLPIGSQLRIPRGSQKLTPSGTARRPGDSSADGQHPDPNRLVPVTQRPPRR